MPIYLYRCLQGHETEKRQTEYEPPSEIDCPDCGRDGEKSRLCVGTPNTIIVPTFLETYNGNDPVLLKSSPDYAKALKSRTKRR